MKKTWIILSLIVIVAFQGIAQKPSIEWVSIPGDTFMMGSPRFDKYKDGDEAQHTVILNGFKMSKYEITVEQFKYFVDSTGYRTDAEKSGGSYIWTGVQYELKAGVNWRYDANGKLRPSKDYNHPVIHISWNDANAFAYWMGFLLPTEAQWEYACRGGTTTPCYTGDYNGNEQVNYNGNLLYSKKCKSQYRENTTPVGSYPPNPFGLHDMNGSVWEWCSDWYGSYPADLQNNPVGPTRGDYKVIRGCGYYFFILGSRSAGRNCLTPESRGDIIGFRLVSQ
jgi:formylglycine-generating enzyme required for sulfatase activity